jgi:hypothetical protein
MGEAQMSPERKLQLLLKHAHLLNQRQICQSLAHTPNFIREPLLRAMSFEQLSDEQFTGIALAAMVIGGACWASLPRMMELNPPKMPLLKHL